MENNYRHILVPTDFSEASLKVLRHSVYTAKYIKAEITLLHVIETYASNSSIGEKFDQEDEKIIKAVTEKLDGTIEQYKNDGIKFNKVVETGKIYKKIIEVADRVNATGIFMSTSGASGMEKIVGTNAIRVVRASKCLVTTIRLTADVTKFGYRNILLPLDLTKETREKLRVAIETAHQFDSKINVVSVSVSKDEFVVNKLRGQLKQVVTLIQKEKIPVTGKLIDGDNIAKAVIDYGMNLKVDSIFIMTQQELGWVEQIIGSAAQQIINHSPVPVISIRPMERKDTTLFPTEY